MEKSNNNSIVLLNGQELVCFPKVQQQGNTWKKLEEDGEIQKNEVKAGLDRFTTLGNRKSWNTEENIFLKNAFFFYRNAHRIMSDSRMFLAPVPIISGLAYTGAFPAPTLGVYIEYWLNGKEGIIRDADGKEALTYHIAGSPLSGCNKCSCVHPDGSTSTISFASFSSVLKSFCSINGRYREAKAKFEAYTLKEVVDILSATENSRESELETRLLIQEGRTTQAKRDFEDIKNQYDSLLDKYTNLLNKYYGKELNAFLWEYKIQIMEAEKKCQILTTAKNEYRTKLKQRELSPGKYQELVHPLTMERNTIMQNLSSFKTDRINELSADGHLTFPMIMAYLRNNGIKDSYL